MLGKPSSAMISRNVVPRRCARGNERFDAFDVAGFELLEQRLIFHQFVVSQCPALAFAAQLLVTPLYRGR